MLIFLQLYNEQEIASKNPKWMIGIIDVKIKRYLADPK